MFDTLFATSLKNDAPSTTPRPWDRDRDGLVIGEGAATLLLEDWDSAVGARREDLRRDRRLRHELRCAPRHAADVGDDGGARCGARCATRALAADAIGYVSGHGTATELGDIAESHATRAVFGERIPISCMKSYFGHTLGACGAQEAWLAIEMMNRDHFAPTLNLDNVDPRCASLDYIVDELARAANRIRDEQQLRVRRHQHVADLPPRARDRRRARNSRLLRRPAHAAGARSSTPS